MKWHFGAAEPAPCAAHTKEGKQLIHGGVFVVRLPTTAIVQYDGICSEDQLIICIRAEMEYIQGDVLLLLLLLGVPACVGIHAACTQNTCE